MAANQLPKSHPDNLSNVYTLTSAFCSLLYMVLRRGHQLYRVSQKDRLNHVVGRTFCLYTDNLFAQIGDSSDKRSSSLEVEC